MIETDMLFSHDVYACARAQCQACWADLQVERADPVQRDGIGRAVAILRHPGGSQCAMAKTDEDHFIILQTVPVFKKRA